ncbi:coiled-coil domain-containing protein 43-like [Penaeus japonicus]|uniref:coiled-coil domain-containing protein 43-like n=1 Tax=Penaeus japonicus TaxID=27405 RepID=UPI001C70F3A3|nr:coiled-coil domain-containing protein 43-like [Penaeus japonicus]
MWVTEEALISRATIEKALSPSPLSRTRPKQEMAEALPCDFDVWLKDTLIALNTDDEVFSPYIKGILEGEENKEEKVEALQGILTEITDTGIESLCDDILKKWSLLGEQEDSKDAEKKVEFEEKIAKIMEEQAQCVVVNKTRSKEEESLKSAILAQYAEVSDGECTDEEEEESNQGLGLGVKNTNAEEVIKAERERREKNKEDSQRKKDKDKEDRAKQKSKDEERKEKEKKRTQKGERRR